LWCSKPNPRLQDHWHDTLLMADTAGMCAVTGMSRSTIARWWREGGEPFRRHSKRGGRPGWRPQPVLVAGRRRFVWHERWTATKATPDDVLRAFYCDVAHQLNSELGQETWQQGAWEGQDVTITIQSE